MKKLLFLSVISFVVSNCNKTNQRFLITDNSVGYLHKNTNVQQIDSLFTNDSVVNSAFSGELRYASNERIVIYEKGGKELLELTPKTNQQNQKIIESIFIKDERYKLANGISLSSTFKDVKNEYKNIDFQTTTNSIIVSPRDENYYFTFDKSALKNTRLGFSSEITADDISDDAHIARITINWE